MNIYGHQSELIIRRDSYNYWLCLFLFYIFVTFLLFLSTLRPIRSQSLIYLNSVQLMSIMDHYGYTTRPLVEFNLSIYTERASFLGWLSHMSERKRLAITLDPASSEPARFKNKRVQASGDMIREESEPEVVPINPPSIWQRLLLIRTRPSHQYALGVDLGRFPWVRSIDLRQFVWWWWLNSPWAPGHICGVSVMLVVVVVLLFWFLCRDSPR